MSVGFTYAKVGWVEDDAPYDDIYIRQDTITSPGQLITHSNITGLAQAVPAGAAGQILIADATSVGMHWGAASGLGSITVNTAGPLNVTGSPVVLGSSILLTNTALNSVGTRSWAAGTGSSYGVDGVSVGDLAVCGALCVSIGSNSFSDASSVGVGAGCLAAGTNSSAIGQISQATFLRASAFGYDSRATANDTLALGARSRANNTGGIAIGMDAVVSSNYCTAIGTGVTNSTPQTTLIGTSVFPLLHCVNSTGYIQSARACAAKAIRDFAGGDPAQSITFASMPTEIIFVSADYDTFTTANNSAIVSWDSLQPKYLNIGAVPYATYMATLNVEMNYNAIYGAVNVNSFQIAYDDNGTTKRIGIATVAQNDVNNLNYRVSVSGQFRVGAAPTGNQRIFAIVNSLDGTGSISLTNVQLSVVRLV